MRTACVLAPALPAARHAARVLCPPHVCASLCALLLHLLHVPHAAAQQRRMEPGACCHLLRSGYSEWALGARSRRRPRSRARVVPSPAGRAASPVELAAPLTSRYRAWTPATPLGTPPSCWQTPKVGIHPHCPLVMPLRTAHLAGRGPLHPPIADRSPRAPGASPAPPPPTLRPAAPPGGPGGGIAAPNWLHTSARSPMMRHLPAWRFPPLPQCPSSYDLRLCTTAEAASVRHSHSQRWRRAAAAAPPPQPAWLGCCLLSAADEGAMCAWAQCPGVVASALVPRLCTSLSHKSTSAGGRGGGGGRPNRMEPPPTPQSCVSCRLPAPHLLSHTPAAPLSPASML